MPFATPMPIRLRDIAASFAALLLSGAALASTPTPAAQANLLAVEHGARVIDFSSEYGGWEASSVTPSLERLREPGVGIEDFVWCTADDAPFPHWVLVELKARRWVTTLVFNNALKDEPAYPGISARHIEIWGSADSPAKLRKIAAFELERNKTGQSVQIDPVELRWLKFNITSNWGHPTWTEMNAAAAYDDGSRPADFATALKATGKADLYGLYFDFGSATLRAESRPTLEKILAFHRANPHSSLQIEGHTDTIGGSAANKDLSLRRARAVVAELERLGVPAGRLRASGFGAEQPVADNGSEAGRAKNRRVTVRLAS